jgi:hypothetical protein
MTDDPLMILLPYGDRTHGVHMTAALDFHSNGVLSISLLPTTAFERSFDSFLNLDRRRKQPAFWTAPLLCSPPLIAFYTQCRCCQPDMFISREVCWIPICFRQAESQQHTAASRAFISFVFHPQQDLPKALKSYNNAPPCFQDDLRITTTTHTQQVYVPPHVITNTTSSPRRPYLIDTHPSAYRSILHHQPQSTIWRLRLTFRDCVLDLVLSPLFIVLIHLSLLFSAGQGMS